MLDYRHICFLACITFLTYSDATPILKGDERPGEMPGLDFPLGTEFWLSPACSIGQLAYEKTKKKHLRRRKGRPEGWIKRELKYGELILNRTLADFRKVEPGELYCPFLTSSCCKLDSLFIQNPEKSQRKFVPYISLKVPEVECQSAPEISFKSWGNCAFVAQGTSLRRVARGHEIDQSDTVIRLGHMPLKGWQRYTGRRTDVIIGRGSIQTRYAGDYARVKILIGSDKASNSYTNRTDSLKRISILNAVTRMPQKISLGNGKSLLIGSSASQLPGLLYDIMTEPINHKKRGPTTGFRHILNILLSGFCKTLHVYGTTPNCGGYYHQTDYLMKVHHSCELESWALHYIMRSSKTELCVWI